MQEAPDIFPDRLVAIRGTVENMSAAEAAISSLLRECVEKHNIQCSLVSTAVRVAHYTACAHAMRQ